MQGNIKFTIEIMGHNEFELTLDVQNMNIAPARTAIPLDFLAKGNSINHLREIIGRKVLELIAYDCRISDQAGLYTTPEHKATRILTGEL